MIIFWWVYSKIDDYFFMRRITREVATAVTICLAIDVMAKSINGEIKEG